MTKRAQNGWGKGEGAGVRIGPLAGIPGLLRELGRDPEPVLQGVGFAPTEFEDPDRVVPYLQASRLLARCVAATGRLDLGFLLGQRASPSSLGMPGFLIGNAPDVGTALRELLRHLDLHDEGGVATLEVRGGIALFGYAIEQQGAEACDQIYDLSLAIVCHIMRALCGPGWDPSEVLLSRPTPADPRPYRRFYRAPISFGAERSAIAFSSAWLDHRVPQADPLLHRYLQREAEQLHTQGRGDLALELRRVLRSLLVSQQCSAGQAARRLHQHERTLHRRLQALGTSYRRELDRVRYAVAQEYLAETSLPLAKIAAALAYTDTTTFGRAFKRWAGVTPAQWRAGGSQG